MTYADFLTVVSFLEALTDAERETLLDELDARFLAGTLDPDAAMSLRSFGEGTCVHWVLSLPD